MKLVPTYDKNPQNPQEPVNIAWEIKLDKLRLGAELNSECETLAIQIDRHKRLTPPRNSYSSKYLQHLETLFILEDRQRRAVNKFQAFHLLYNLL